MAVSQVSATSQYYYEQLILAIEIICEMTSEFCHDRIFARKHCQVIIIMVA